MTDAPLLGEFEQLVLLAVARLGEESYGVTVRQEIEDTAGRPVSIGAVYRTLDRLEEKGLVSSWTGEPTAVRGGRAKRHFRMEEAGARALEASRQMLERMWEGVEFGPQGGPA